MQALIKKNKIFRNKYKNLELNYYINSALTKNKILKKQALLLPFPLDSLKKENPSSRMGDKGGIKRNINISPKISKIRNLCVLTGRSRAIIQDYKLSRLKFKELAEAGYIPGVKKK